MLCFPFGVQARANVPHDIVCRLELFLSRKDWGRLVMGVDLLSHFLPRPRKYLKFVIEVGVATLTVAAGLLVGLSGRCWSNIVLAAIFIHQMSNPALLAVPPAGFRVVGGRGDGRFLLLCGYCDQRR